MVEEYLETQHQRNAEHSTKDSKSESTVQKKGIGSTVSTTGEDTDTHTGTVSDEKIGTSKKNGSSEDTKYYKGERTVQEQGTGSDDLTYSGQKTVSEIESGSDDKSYVGSEKTDQTRTPDLVQSTEGSSSSKESAKTVGMAKSMPMSASYAAATAGSLPAADWSNPSSQTQTESNTEGSDSNSQKVSNTGTEHTVNTKTFDGRADKGTSSGTKSSTEGFTDRKDARATADSKSTTEGFTDRQDSDQGSSSEDGSTSESGTTTYAESQAHKKGTTVKTTPDEDKEDSSTISGSGSGSGEEASLDREVHTGRHGYPSEILDKAQAFIKHSSAWEWLASQLDENFMHVYDIDDIWNQMQEA